MMADSRPRLGRIARLALVLAYVRIPASLGFTKYAGRNRRTILLEKSLQVSSRNPKASHLYSTFAETVPQLSTQDLHHLAYKGWLVVDDFIDSDLQKALREDVSELRRKGNFKVAKIGQDATNTLNQDIRVAETCFIGPDKTTLPNNGARNHLYTVLNQLRRDLSQNPALKKGVTEDVPPLDAGLSELLYAYYPKGGFYRRHVDAVQNSASVLRCYSLLLYLNKDWDPQKGGELRMHFDGGGDYPLDPKAPSNHRDVSPKCGTLVLFKSDMIPHEVLDTKEERVAVVGWYNRAVTASDISNLGGSTQTLMLAVAAALITVGVASLIT